MKESRTKKYVKYYRALAEVELTPLKNAPAEIEDMPRPDGTPRRGADTHPLKEFGEAEAFLADYILLHNAENPGAEKTDSLIGRYQLPYVSFRIPEQEFRSRLTGHGLITREKVKHLYTNPEAYKMRNYIIPDLKGKKYQAAGIVVNMRDTGAGVGREVKILHPAAFTQGAFFFAPSSLQAKIKNLKEQRPELFYRRDSKFEVSELLARKFFLYLGLHQNPSGVLNLKIDEMFRVIRPAMFFPATGKCRSRAAAGEMLASLINIYNEVIAGEPAAVLTRIKSFSQSREGEVRLEFQKMKPKKTAKFWQFRKRRSLYSGATPA